LEQYFLAVQHGKLQGPVSLRPVLKAWWDEAFKREKRKKGTDDISVTCMDLVRKLNAWICDKM